MLASLHLWPLNETGWTPGGSLMLWRNCASSPVPFPQSEMEIKYLLLSPLTSCFSFLPQPHSQEPCSLFHWENSQPKEKSHRLPTTTCPPARIDPPVWSPLSLWMNILLSNLAPTTMSMWWVHHLTCPTSKAITPTIWLSCPSDFLLSLLDHSYQLHKHTVTSSILKVETVHHKHTFDLIPSAATSQLLHPSSWQKSIQEPCALTSASCLLVFHGINSS